MGCNHDKLAKQLIHLMTLCFLFFWCILCSKIDIWENRAFWQIWQFVNKSFSSKWKNIMQPQQSGTTASQHQLCSVGESTAIFGEQSQGLQLQKLCVIVENRIVLFTASSLQTLSVKNPLEELFRNSFVYPESTQSLHFTSTTRFQSLTVAPRSRHL